VENNNNNSMEKIEESSIVEFERGLATDCGIIGSMMFVAQFTMSLSIGSIITFFDSVSAVLYAASFFSCLASISALFVVYVDS
jgi:solute carrier family 45, member 1/2/4